MTPSIGYDDAGRLIGETNGGDSRTYEWDALDQLTAFDDGTTSVSYSYDALGHRADRTVASTTETAHYGDLTDIATLDTDAGGVIRSFFSGPAGLVEQRDGSTTDFPLPDAHGDVTAFSDSSGAVASRQEFDPWGEQLTGPAIEMGWLGAQERRSEPIAQFVQMGVRAYDPIGARFLGEDQMLGRPHTPQTLNRMTFALGQPIDRQDLDGQCVIDDVPLFSDACDVIGDVSRWSYDTARDNVPYDDAFGWGVGALGWAADQASCAIGEAAIPGSACGSAAYATVSPSESVERSCFASSVSVGAGSEWATGANWVTGG